MQNIFTIINNYIDNNTNTLYCEIGKNDNKDNIIKRLCSHEEYIQYKHLQKQDKQKLLNNVEVNNQQNKQNNTVYVNGIGNVTQIC